ncbi:MAG: endonuclease/exonuclease/phosphatase family protein [Clostridia bacterium]|nr:endonuclease/exonuclease/phosphatase family protein [Clostridia bacterium]
MSIKIMSFNLRYDSEHDGINSFTNRIERVIKVIENEQADIIGFQEVTDSMRTRIRERLSDKYTLVGCGRDSNYHGEAMLIAFKSDIFEFISLDNIWLSTTPNIPGTRYGGDHSSCPRMYTSILLKHDEIDKPFRFINTHLDHVGANGRVLEATQLLNDICAYQEKFILTGDFNAEPSSPEIRLITDCKSKSITDCTEGLCPTFHDFGRLPQEKRLKIDYIFTDGACLDSYAIIDTPVNGQYYSDHYAVCALIEL